MTVYAEHLSTEAQQFNWLLTQFAANTPEVIDAIAVSSDGLLIAMSQKLDRANADRLAAITSAVISLAQGAGRVYDLGAPNKAYEMAVFANRAGEVISPQLIEELKVSVGY